MGATEYVMAPWLFWETCLSSLILSVAVSIAANTAGSATSPTTTTETLWTPIPWNSLLRMSIAISFSLSLEKTSSRANFFSTIVERP